VRSILHCITTICRGGAETQLLTLARQQVLAGNQVSVVYLKGLPELHQDFTNAGVKVIDTLANLSPITQIYKLRRIINNNTFNVVHNHLPRAELFFRLTCLRRPYIFSRHNAEPFFPKAPKFVSRALSLYASSGNCRGIAISIAVKTFSENNGEISRRKPLEVIYYGFDPVQIKSDISLVNRHYSFGTVARLVPQKNLPTLLQAFKIVASRNDSANLIIIGDGIDSGLLHELTNNLGLKDRVTWLVKSHDVPKQLSQIETFILPSLYEGFGLVLLEAMSAKCAIIAANNSAIPEVLGTDFPGLFETKSVPDLVALMEKAQTGTFRDRLVAIQDARLRIFGPEAMESKINLLYCQLTPGTH
jgi:glycosyltransferase involved in cell wall biosynthesis